ncbi:hypothetical protein HBH56_018640 [Parastagonospora nodorum]|uniref:GPI anchored cell wall protein n=2 Tax=Phaeosphaeria nodorum (strain SN15 / ATCC MYA-4574 / FGSC 10173) TaxID=321614 RepID=A0A7U2F261_PHANO|nr:hypothetical protein SNOG_02987 [Parastagonospora nodorum SN15]KAH3919778.1 hypothetical protein HBH56_018640 [Parastagonospora nodorum]EAT89718.2 hypothetical protein SNOG_02987 [Parastagonospora nodorum SN15]KAH3937502.1 hypothetical protein HBH54_015850 [Parastagonospora nodorum]KAH3990685.1 hypothetical protein HBH52_004760 [Parastagonospora nodorum]KAH4137165.1 hypothetical protein HBH45_124940 [Parastagonospora nodorum]
MRQSIAIISLLSGAVMAADTIPFYFPGGSEGADPVAVIKKVEPSTTEFSIACPTGVDSDECGWGPGLDYTIISNTHYQAYMSAASVSMSFACDHNTQASEMTCTVAMTGGDMDLGGPQTAVLKGDEISFNQATIVGGASLLSNSPAQATPAAGASGSASAQATPTASAGSSLMTAASSAVATGSAVRSSMGNTTHSATGSAAPAEHTGAASKFIFQAPALLAIVGAVAAAL